MNTLRVWFFLLINLMVASASAAEALRVGGVGSLTPLMQRLIADYAKRNPAIDIQLIHPPLGSSGAVRAIAAGKLDLALMGRELKPEESGIPQPWLKTPLVLATAGGKTRGLSRSDLADIYAGRRTTWDDGRPIRLVLRSLHESETTVLRTLSPGVDAAVTDALKRNTGTVAENDLEALAMLVSIPGSFGSTTLGLISSSGSAAQLLDYVALDGIKPDPRKLEKQSYPWYRIYTLVTPVQPSLAAQAFTTYLQSPAALAIAREHAFLPAIR